MIEGRLAGKVTLLSGIARGMGKTAAERFAAEGAIVVGADLDGAGGEATAAGIRAKGGEATFVLADLGTEPGVSSWVKTATDLHGRIDVLYNNASAPKVDETPRMPIEDWEFILRNELTIVFLSVKHAVPHMPRGSVIINIGSVAGVPGIGTAMPGNAPGGAPHAATKAGVIAMTRSWAVEFGSLGIRVVCISPGLIETPGTAALFDDPVLGEACSRLTLLGRWGRPDDVVSAAVFLASEEAAYITGCNLLVDGGWSAMGTGFPAVTFDQLTGRAGY